MSPKFPLFCLLAGVAATLAGCASKAPPPDPAFAEQSTKNSIENIRNDPKMSDAEKDGMIAQVRKNLPPDLKAKAAAEDGKTRP